MTDQPGFEAGQFHTGSAADTTMNAPAPSGPRRFRRSRQDRVLAGVCGGLAESLVMDPVIVRVLMVVLTFFGGAGIIVYIACWLLMPDDDRETSLAERAIARGGENPWPVLVLAGALGLAGVLSAGWLVDDRGLLLIALLVIAAILLSRRDTALRAGRTGTAGTAQVVPPPPTSATSFRATFDEPAATSSPSTAWPAASTEPLPPLGPTPPTPPRSPLGRVTVALVLLALGTLAIVDLSGAEVPAAAYPALAIAGAGLGLLIGTRYGRGRALIALGVLGVLALPPTVFADSYRGGWVNQGEHPIAPADVAGIAPEYSYDGGHVQLDLTGVDFTNQAVATHLRVGVGEVEVILPPNVDVLTDLDLGVGVIEAFGSEHNGFGVSRAVRDDGVDGIGDGTFELEIEQGIGHLEVRRAAA